MNAAAGHDLDAALERAGITGADVDEVLLARMGPAELLDSMVLDGLTDAFGSIHMGITAENVADLSARTLRRARCACPVDVWRKFTPRRAGGTARPAATRSC
jgi:hypothetical protein